MKKPDTKQWLTHVVNSAIKRHAVGDTNVLYVDRDREEIVRELTGFVPVQLYARPVDLVAGEIGSYDGIRIVATHQSLRDIARQTRAKLTPKTRRILKRIDLQGDA